jgi:hypothetical protein
MLRSALLVCSVAWLPQSTCGQDPDSQRSFQEQRAELLQQADAAGWAARQAYLLRTGDRSGADRAQRQAYDDFRRTWDVWGADRLPTSF